MRLRLPPDRTERILQLFLPRTAPLVSVKRAGTTYRLARAIADGRYAEWDLRPFIGGGANNQLLTHRIGIAMLSVDQNDASVARSAGWTLGATTVTGSYGGSYNLTETVGAYEERTCPPGSESCGFRAIFTSNGGYAKVTGVVANLLPTAQEEVDAGRLTSAALIANGGTLDPADRLLDLYSSDLERDRLVVIATGLSPSGTHVPRYTHTGYRNVGNTSGVSRLYTSGYMHGTSSTLISDAGAEIAALRVLQSTDSAADYAFQLLPSGASTSTLVGSVHTNEVQDSISFAVEGDTVVLADGDRETGASVVATRNTHLLHPETGGTHIADLETTFALTGRDLAVRLAPFDWLVDTRVDLAYVHMFPLDAATFTRAHSLGLAAPITLDHDDNLFYGASRAGLGWMWDPDEGYAAALHVPNVVEETNNWARSAPHYMDFQDRGTGQLISKAYVARVGNPATPENVTAGTTWGPFEGRYMTTILGDAEALLAAA